MKKRFLWLLSCSVFLVASHPEHEQENDIFHDALEEPIDTRSTLEQEEAALAARLAQEHDQQTSTSTPARSNPPRSTVTEPSSSNQESKEPIRTGPGNTISDNLNKPLNPILLPVGPSAQEVAQETMKNSLVQVQQAVEDAQLNGNVKAFNRAWNAYKAAYIKNSKVSPDFAAQYQPLTVLNQLVSKVPPVEKNAIQNALQTALAGPSLTIKLVGSDATRAEAISSNLRNGIKMFVNAVNQINTLTLLLQEQAALMTEKVNARQMTTDLYNRYANQWNKRVAQLQGAMQPGINLNGRLREFANNVHMMMFIDVGGDNVTLDSIKKQIEYVQQLDTVYSNYLTCFAKAELQDPLAGTDEELSFGLFDFVKEINVDQELRRQIALAQLREEAQPFYKRFIVAIKNLLYPSSSVANRWEVLQEQLLSEQQQNLYEMTRLTQSEVPLSDDQISIAGRIEENCLANSALANYPSTTLSIDDFKSLLKYDEKKQSVDQLFLHAFFNPLDMTEEERNTYTFTRSGARLLKVEYVEKFIKYRLLGLADQTTNFNCMRGMKKLMSDDNSIWSGLTDTQKESLQSFISKNTYWDLEANQFVLDLNVDDLVNENDRIATLNAWLEFTEATQAWVKNDIRRLNELMRHDYTSKPLSRDDVDLVFYYLCLEKSLSGEDAPVAQNGLLTIDNVAYLCFPSTGWAVRQALVSSVPVNLVTFINYAKNMDIFFNGKDGIKDGYLSLQAAYVVNLNASMQQQAANTSVQANTYTTLLAPTYQRYPGALLAVLNDQPIASGDGGGGGHGHSELKLQLKLVTKCYNDEGQEVACKEKEGFPYITIHIGG